MITDEGVGVMEFINSKLRIVWGYFYANGIASAFTEGVLFPGMVLFYLPHLCFSLILRILSLSLLFSNCFL